MFVRIERRDFKVDIEVEGGRESGMISPERVLTKIWTGPSKTEEEDELVDAEEEDLERMMASVSSRSGRGDR